MVCIMWSFFDSRLRRLAREMNKHEMKHIRQWRLPSYRLVAFLLREMNKHAGADCEGCREVLRCAGCAKPTICDWSHTCERCKRDLCSSCLAESTGTEYLCATCAELRYSEAFRKELEGKYGL